MRPQQSTERIAPPAIQPNELEQISAQVDDLERSIVDKELFDFLLADVDRSRLTQISMMLADKGDYAEMQKAMDISEKLDRLIAKRLDETHEIQRKSLVLNSTSQNADKDILAIIQEAKHFDPTSVTPAELQNKFSYFEYHFFRFQESDFSQLLELSERIEALRKQMRENTSTVKDTPEVLEQSPTAVVPNPPENAQAPSPDESWESFSPAQDYTSIYAPIAQEYPPQSVPAISPNSDWETFTPPVPTEIPLSPSPRPNAPDENLDISVILNSRKNPVSPQDDLLSIPCEILEDGQEITSPVSVGIPDTIPEQAILEYATTDIQVATELENDMYGNILNIPTTAITPNSVFAEGISESYDDTLLQDGSDLKITIIQQICERQLLKSSFAEWGNLINDKLAKEDEFRKSRDMIQLRSVFLAMRESVYASRLITPMEAKRQRQIARICLQRWMTVAREFDAKCMHVYSSIRTKRKAALFDSWISVFTLQRIAVEFDKRNSLKRRFSNWRIVYEQSLANRDNADILSFNMTTRHVFNHWLQVHRDHVYQRKCAVETFVRVINRTMCQSALGTWKSATKLGLQAEFAKKAALRRAKAIERASVIVRNFIQTFAVRSVQESFADILQFSNDIKAKEVTPETSETETPPHATTTASPEDAVSDIIEAVVVEGSDLDTNVASSVVDVLECTEAFIVDTPANHLVIDVPKHDTSALIHQTAAVVIEPTVKQVEKLAPHIENWVSFTESADIQIVSSSISHTPRESAAGRFNCNSPGVEYYSISDPEETDITRRPTSSVEDLRKSTNDIIIKTQIFLSQHRPQRPLSTSALTTTNQAGPSPLVNNSSDHSKAVDKWLDTHKRGTSSTVRTIADQGYFMDFERKWALEEQKWHL